MSLRLFAAALSFLVGWLLLLFFALGSTALGDPDFYATYEDTSPVPAASDSELRISLVVLTAVPGSAFCLLGLFLWTSHRRRLRQQELTREAFDSWSRRALDQTSRAWLEAERWQAPDLSEVRELSSRLGDRERAYLRRFLQGANLGTVHFPSPSVEAVSDETPSTRPNCLFWVAFIVSVGLAGLILVWSFLSGWLIPEWAAAEGLEPRVSPGQARGILVLGIGLAAIPTVSAGVLLASATARRARRSRISRLRTERSRATLENTCGLLKATRTIEASEETRDNLRRGLVQAALPELTAEDREQLSAHVSK